MVVLSRIYTRTGDSGETSLGDGRRVSKDHLRIETGGAVDEVNATIGLARLYISGLVDEMLGRVQNELFDLGADLTVPQKPNEDPAKALRVTDEQVARLEREIDQMNVHLEPLKSFVLPGGTQGAAFLHLARTVARRAERLMVALAREEKVSAPALKYVNRLSDFLFVAARFVNDKGGRDRLWKPGATRR